MKIAVGSDEKTALTDALVEELTARGHELLLFGPLTSADSEVDWPQTSGHVAEAVASGRADEGIVCCWTGTGASIAANKVRGVRAALCQDAETAKGARRWNDANVLALSLRASSEAVAGEIVDAFLATADLDPAEAANVRAVTDLERRRPLPVAAGGITE